jgi:hypothetical protein
MADGPGTFAGGVSLWRQTCPENPGCRINVLPPYSYMVGVSTSISHSHPFTKFLKDHPGEPQVFNRILKLGRGDNVGGLFQNPSQVAASRPILLEELPRALRLSLHLSLRQEATSGTLGEGHLREGFRRHQRGGLDLDSQVILISLSALSERGRSQREGNPKPFEFLSCGLADEWSPGTCKEEIIPECIPGPIKRTPRTQQRRFP